MILSSDILALPKAEIHAHVEGTVTPEKARMFAGRNGVVLPSSLFTADGRGYRYENFLDLVTKVYQAVADCLRTGRDYEDAVYDYLTRCAAENTLYVELIAWPGQCGRVGIGYREMIDGIAAGIDRARAGTGIEARLNVAFERHRPGAEAEKDAALILSYGHPYIVGLDIAGGEREGDLAQFEDVWRRTREGFEAVYGRRLGSRLHAIEGAGPVNGWAALRFDPSRGGHFVRCGEDADLVAELKRRGVVLEICPTSNILLVPEFGGDFARHPMPALYKAGLRLTLNSDDPGMFPDCSIGGEYQIAHDRFGFTPRQLLEFTRNALAAAYLDEDTRQRLLARVDAYEADLV